MTGDEQADIRNRFEARYRELPGVGCFATGLMQRDENLFTTIFHGSNWMVLHRRHCSVLLEAEAAGHNVTGPLGCAGLFIAIAAMVVLWRVARQHEKRLHLHMERETLD